MSGSAYQIQRIANSSAWNVWMSTFGIWSDTVQVAVARKHQKRRHFPQSLLNITSGSSSWRCEQFPVQCKHAASIVCKFYNEILWVTAFCGKYLIRDILELGTYCRPGYICSRCTPFLPSTEILWNMPHLYISRSERESSQRNTTSIFHNTKVRDQGV